MESCHWALRGVSLELQGSGFMVVWEAEEVMVTYGDQERHFQKGDGDVGREGQFIFCLILQVQRSDRKIISTSENPLEMSPLVVSPFFRIVPGKFSSTSLPVAQSVTLNKFHSL